MCDCIGDTRDKKNTVFVTAPIAFRIMTVCTYAPFFTLFLVLSDGLYPVQYLPSRHNSLNFCKSNGCIAHIWEPHVAVQE